MMILDDIGEDQFLKVRGIEVLLIEDFGGREEVMADRSNIYTIYLQINISELSIFQNSMSYLSKFI